MTGTISYGPVIYTEANNLIKINSTIFTESHLSFLIQKKKKKNYLGWIVNLPMHSTV
jgi:hypothetical protein